MEKTAMQFAIEWVNDNYPKFNHYEIEAKLTELRDTVEKEQIINAFTEGARDCEAYWRLDELLYNEDGKTFYNKTYKP